jgi:ABC-2 type transport system permease protein
MKGLSKYTTTVKLGIQEAMEYRVDFFFSLINGCFTVFVQFFMWTAIYGGKDEAILYGFTYAQMIVYIIMAGILWTLTSTGFEYEVADDIREGTLSRFLVQPISYFPYRTVLFLGRKILAFAVITLVSAVVLATLHFTLGAEFAATDIFMTFLVVPLSLLLNCVMYFCISTSAFWLTRAWGVFQGMHVVSSVLSGGIFPLDVFGPAAMEVFKFLPFKYVIYFPLNIICGKASGEDIFFGLLMQFTWIIIFYGFSRILWKMGMKRYIAAGG